MRSTGITVHGVVIVVGLFAMNEVNAYERYHDPSLIDQGYCAECHPGFGRGTGDALHALHTGGDDPVTTNCNLCHNGSGRDNPFIMWSVNDGFGCMGCHGREYGETIAANYQGFPTSGKTKASGYGLRQHHVSSGITECLDCHADDQVEILPENVNPPYYARSDVGLGGQQADACANEDTTNDSDAAGLDNDGDLTYDADDSDCTERSPDIRLTPTSLDFGSVVIGETVTRAVEIQNLGTADLTVTVIELCLGTTTEYSWSPDMEFTVTAGGSQTLSVTYAPLDEGADTGCLTVQSDDPDEPVVELALAGTGEVPPSPAIEVTPGALDFGTVLVGDALEQPLAVRNGGTAILEVSQVTLCAGSSAEFTWTPLAPFSVAPGQAQTVLVRYAPSDAGLDEGCVEIDSNDPIAPRVEVLLSGTGEEPPVEVPAIVLAPNALDFGTIFFGESAERTFDVRNVGTVDLEVSAIGLCDGTSAEYSWAPSAPLTVVAGGSQTVTVAYTPLDTNLDVGCLAVESNDPALPRAELAVSGRATERPVEAPDLVVEPSMLDFGAVSVGETFELTAEIRNQGTAALEIFSVERCPDTSDEFTWTPEAPFAVPPGESQLLRVTFAPVLLGAVTGCLSISSNDPDTPLFDLGLQGSGQEPPGEDIRIEIEPTALDFGTVLVGEESARQVEVRNASDVGTVVIEVLGCSETSPEFGWEPQELLSIPPRASVELLVIYAPADAGVDEGCLELRTEDPEVPGVELAVVGSGVEPSTAVVDLDIREFSATKKLKLQGSTFVQLRLTVENAGAEDEPRPGSVVGVQNGVEVYREVLMVSDDLAAGGTRFRFPDFEPTTSGTIEWTLTIDDDDIDVDEATAVTQVEPSPAKGKSGGPVDPLLLALVGAGLLMRRRLGRRTSGG